MNIEQEYKRLTMLTSGEYWPETLKEDRRDSMKKSNIVEFFIDSILDYKPRKEDK